MRQLKVGDRVIRNPVTWRGSEFDSWGAGEGIGLIVEPHGDHQEGVFFGQETPGGPYLACVDVRWPAGRCFQFCDELLLAEDLSAP